MPHWKVKLPITPDMHNIYWPQKCPCCGGDIDSNFDLSRDVQTPLFPLPGNIYKKFHLTLNVPYCNVCLRHTIGVKLPQMWKLVLWVITILALFLQPGLVTYSIIIGIKGFWGNLIAISFIILFLTESALFIYINIGIRSRIRRKLTTASCISHRIAVWNDPIMYTDFYFLSKEYADAFASANHVGTTEYREGPGLSL